MTRAAILIVVLFWSVSTAAETPAIPTVDQMVALKRAASPAISPDGRLVAYTVREANWDENSFDTQIWIADATTGNLRQLTRSKKSSSSPTWSPDGRQLAFISDRSDKRQIYLIDPAGGEAQVLTSLESGVNSLQWSPDGSRIAFTAAEPKTESAKERDKKYGEFTITDEDRGQTHLWLLDVEKKSVERLTNGQIAVGSFAWSPDGTRIAYDHRADEDPSHDDTSDIAVVNVADRSTREIVTQAGPDGNPRWSPDGSSIVFRTSMASTGHYFTNAVLASVPASGGPITVLTRAFDEDPFLQAWAPDGVYFMASQRTDVRLFRIDPATRVITPIDQERGQISSSFSFTKDFRRVAFVKSSATLYAEVFVADLPDLKGKQLTTLGDQLNGWALGTSEVISWRSSDGATIEGVLHKPADFRSGQKYPLLVVIHGGPTGTSRPARFSSGYVYPIDAWVARGALVLEPNYRGSAGYGEKFRALNVRNLGIGDAWDVVSGIDDLVSKGMVDPARVGAMGWSQGGYISAFLTTHDSSRFKAISVGAGISDWMTYYVNTDIHPFTRQYLKATPWDDPEVYRKTSPISYIKQARTPTLIQHGELDQRVPIPNAYELYQGLRDQNVPTRLIVYKGFGHGLGKPKAIRAAMEHNIEWFDRYFWATSSKVTATQ